MVTVTFIIDRQKYLDGRNQFTVLRMSEDRLEVVSRHESVDEAVEAAHRYASKARFTGLDVRIFRRE